MRARDRNGRLLHKGDFVIVRLSANGQGFYWLSTVEDDRMRATRERPDWILTLLDTESRTSPYIYKAYAIDCEWITKQRKRREQQMMLMKLEGREFSD